MHSSNDIFLNVFGILTGELKYEDFVSKNLTHARNFEKNVQMEDFVFLSRIGFLAIAMAKMRLDLETNKVFLPPTQKFFPHDVYFAVSGKISWESNNQPIFGMGKTEAYSQEKVCFCQMNDLESFIEPIEASIVFGILTPSLIEKEISSINKSWLFLHRKRIFWAFLFCWYLVF